MASDPSRRPERDCLSGGESFGQCFVPPIQFSVKSAGSGHLLLDPFRCATFAVWVKLERPLISSYEPNQAASRLCSAHSDGSLEGEESGSELAAD